MFEYEITYFNAFNSVRTIFVKANSEEKALQIARTRAKYGSDFKVTY